MTQHQAKDVLLVAHTRLSTTYVHEYHDLLAADPRLRFWITRAPDRLDGGVTDAVAGLIRDSADRGRVVHPISFEQARSQRWDLALFGTHGSRELLRDDVPCVHIQHGIGAGKTALGDDFTYGPTWSLRQGGPHAGEPLYEIMLESSHAVRARAVRRIPRLADRIQVVGDIVADRLLQTDARRDVYRDALGIEPGQTAVLLISTWGPDGLMGPTGDRGLEFLKEAVRLGDRCRILLSMHPHLWFGAGDSGPELWRRRLTQFAGSGLSICGPDESWMPYLAAADVAIIDHSSLCLYFGLLNRPTIAVPVPAESINPAAPIAALRLASPLLEQPVGLKEAIATAIATFDPRLMPGRADILAHRGASVRRIVTALYPTLGLSPPQSLPDIPPAEPPCPFLLSAGHISEIRASGGLATSPHPTGRTRQTPLAHREVKATPPVAGEARDLDGTVRLPDLSDFGL
ncbi:hypothetical protein [Pseudofrankia sp. DC12]|uniref:hypothetical protein n=1 Tax=Pseudofrankia sp. DC12 TaxID=683315 RepID=UPI0005F7DCD4|nr:hypothetical protein [Pseudofrankia sp. DC12]